MAERVACAVCGKVSVGRVPKGGDGTLIMPSRHYVETKPGRPMCEGSYMEGKPHG